MVLKGRNSFERLLHSLGVGEVIINLEEEKNGHRKKLLTEVTYLEKPLVI